MASSQSVKRGQFPSSCHLCESSPNIKFKCLDCNLLMCQKCRDKIHVKIKNAERHKVVDIKDIGTESEIDFTNLKCDDHSAFCCLFCKSCDFLVCPTCVAKGHKKHDLIEINEGHQEKLEQIEGKKQNTEKYLSNIKAVLGNLAQINSMHKGKMVEEEKKIEDHRKALKMAVDFHINKLLSDLQQSGKEVITATDFDIQTIQRTEQEVKTKDKILEELLTTANAKNFFTGASKLSSYNSNVPLTSSIFMSIPTFIPGDITSSHVGELQSMSNKESESPKINLQIKEKYQTQLSDLTNVCPCTDGSLWIGCYEDKLVQRVKPDKDKLKVISTINTTFFGMASTTSNDLLISTDESRLQQISCKTGQINDTRYDVTPLVATSVHITREEKVIIGGYNYETDRRAVFVMDKDGRHEKTYEHDKHNKPLFNYPYDITSTRNGYINVVDCDSYHERGRIVVLSQEGDIRNIYNGHPCVNKDKPFFPGDIATSPRSNVMVVDKGTSYLHFLDNTGDLLFAYDTNDAGINYPCSLAFTSTGSLLIGHSRPAGSQAKDAKLYQVNITRY